MRQASFARIHCFSLVFVISCSETGRYQRPNVDDSHAKQPSVVIEGKESDIKNVGTVKKEFEALKVVDLDLAVVPTITCNQSSLTVAGNAATLVMTCNLILPNGGLASTELWPGKFEWAFSHRTMDPVTVQIDNSVNGGTTGRFTFTGAESMRLLYVADTGNYTVKHTGAKAGFALDKVKLTVTGETCRTPLGGLINVRQTAGYTNFTTPTGGGSINIVPPEQGGRFLVSNSTLQSNLIGSVILGLNNSRINHLGPGGTVTIFDGTTYTTDSLQRAIYTSPYAAITPGPNTNTIYRFRSELGLCERE